MERACYESDVFLLRKFDSIKAGREILPPRVGLYRVIFRR